MSDAPLSYRLPCSGCVHLMDDAPEALRKTHLRCGWTGRLPMGTTLNWGAAQYKTRKAVHGPFAETARQIECQTFTP